MVSLTTPIENVPKISRRIVPALGRLGIKTILDLLFHFPSRYDDFSNEKKIRSLTAGESATVRGKIVKISIRRTARRHMMLTEAEIDDGTGKIKALWFNQPYLIRNWSTGTALTLSGKVALGSRGLYLQNPAHEKSSGTEIHTKGLVAIYPETSGVTSRWIRFLIHSFIGLGSGLRDPLPDEIRKRRLLPGLKEALREIHFPKTKEGAERARRRFDFEELLLIQLRALRERAKLNEKRAPEIPLNLPLIKKFVGSLPYALTDAQRRSLWEILQDISKSRPMNRLLEGDVGSGKTVVAAGAALLTVHRGMRVAFMAPTEILARQHFDTLSKILSPLGAKIGLMLGAEKRTDNTSEIIVGTHALIQRGVNFENLGLAVVDEQHRFGVNQRMALVRGQKHSLVPHFLSMSATPIPRTLALTIYGDLDLSILDEMPKSRKPTITKIVEPSKRGDAYEFIREGVKRGGQVFVICPRIEIPNDKNQTSNQFQNQNSKYYQQKILFADVKNVKEEYKKLAEHIFPDLRVVMLHGKMKSKEKDEIMKNFRGGDADILVSTSVIEVGVDIPNATIMMIEGAERFGLAQLHQFRGRVGRGTEQSYCFLFPTEDGLRTRRLRAVVEAKNGFELAEKDLEIRGPGDLFGIRQSGIPTTLYKALTDAKLIREVRSDAAELLKKSSDLADYSLLKQKLEELEKTVHLE